MTIFGTVLLALTDDGGRMVSWDIESGGGFYEQQLISTHLKPDVADFNSTIQFDSGFTAISILHPATYINKVLVSSSEGSMQLWNVRSQYVSRTPHQNQN